MKNPTLIPRLSASGFTLVEVVIALGLFVFALTALIGVIPVGMLQIQASTLEGNAMSAMESIRDDVNLALKSKSSESRLYKLAIPIVAASADNATTAVDLKVLDNGDIAGPTGNPMCRIIGALTIPGGARSEPPSLHLRATWPAEAAAGKEQGAVEIVAAFQR